MPDYDHTEGYRIFAQSRANLLPHVHGDDRRRAAGELLKTLVDATTGSGYEEQNDSSRGALFIGIPRLAGVYLRRGEYGHLEMRAHDDKTPIPLAIEYDPTTKKFIGTERRTLLASGPEAQAA